MSSFNFQEGATTEDTVKMLLEALNWIMSKLDSKNVGRLDTNETVIKSKDGETHISGPLLLMYDKQGTPVLRLKMGYDAASLNFVYQLMNAAGDITVNIDSNGDLTVERGTFKGSITIGTGNNVFKADSNGIYLGNAVFASAPFRVAMDGSATATSLTVIGGSITGSSITGSTITNIGSYVKTIFDTFGAHFINQVGGSTSNIEKITIYVEYDGNGNIKFTENTGTKFAYIFMTDTKFGINSDLPIEITASNTTISKMSSNDIVANRIDGNVDIIMEAGTGGTIDLNVISSRNVKIGGTTSGVSFFGGIPASKTSVTDPSSIVTTETADATYDANEVSMLNNLKTDVSNLNSKLTALIDALQSYGIV